MNSSGAGTQETAPRQGSIPARTAGPGWRTAQAGIIVLAGAAAYAASLSAPFVMDDRSLLQIAAQKPADILLHGGPRRITDLTFLLNAGLHGLQESGFRLVNLTIHLATALLLYLFLGSALAALRDPLSSGAGPASREQGFTDRFVPFCAALLFAVHPLQTQAVTYIIQRYTSLAAFFYLLAAFSYVRARLALDAGGAGAALFPAGACLIAGLLALGSKQIAVTLPFMLMVIEVCLFRGRRLRPLLFAACGGLLLLALVAAGVKGGGLTALLFDLRQATAEDLYITRTSYLLTQACVVASYLRLLLLPYGQSLVHDYPVYQSLLAPPVMAAVLLHLALITAAAATCAKGGRNLRNGDRQRGELQRLAALGVFWFYLAMTVESSVFPIRDVINEHRVYLPSPGFFTALAALAALAVQSGMFSRRTAWLLAAAAGIVLTCLTISRNRVWSDSLALWREAAARAPGKPLALTNLGSEYLALGMPGEALPLFVKAAELNAEYQELILGRQFYIGRALEALRVYEGRFSTGREFIVRAGPDGAGIRARENRARFEAVKNNTLGLAYEHLGNAAMAVKAYRYAAAMDPGYDLAWYNLGQLSLRSGDRQRAEAALVRLKELNPALAAGLASEPAWGVR